MKTKPQLLVPSVLLALTLAGTTFAAGPYSPTNWPPTINPTKKVHYVVTDGAASFIEPTPTGPIRFSSSAAAIQRGRPSKYACRRSP